MPTFGNITIGTQVFKPAGRDTVTNTASYEERSGGVPIGYPSMRVRQSKNAQTRRTRTVVTFPVLQTAIAAGADGFTPAARVGHSSGFTLDFVSSTSSSEAERQATLDAIIAYVQSDYFASLVRDQEEITG